MESLKLYPASNGENIVDETLFGLIADDVERQGYSVRPCALQDDILSDLYSYQQNLNTPQQVSDVVTVL